MNTHLALQQQLKLTEEEILEILEEEAKQEEAVKLEAESAGDEHYSWPVTHRCDDGYCCESGGYDD